MAPKDKLEEYFFAFEMISSILAATIIYFMKLIWEII